MDADFGYTGHYYHQPSGLLLAPYRAYSPSIGRWLSRDPLDNAEMLQGPNLYGYVRNNPIGYVDRDGKELIAAGIGALIGGGINAYNNYNAYQSGQMSGAAYAESIAFGAGTGALSGLIPGLGGVVAGALTAGLNDATNQALQGKCNIDWGHAGITAGIGLGGGLIGSAGEWAGNQVLGNIDSVGLPLGSPLPTYGTAGGIIGNATGSLLGNLYK